MNYERGELCEQLAGAYVVGTLRGPARLRFARACATSHYLRAAVGRWEDRLLPLLGGVPPVSPSAHVWAKILGRTSSLSAPPHGRRIWRWAVTGALALSLGGLISVRVLYPPLSIVAEVGRDRRPPLWSVLRSGDSMVLEIRALQNVQSNPRSAYELWALQRNGGPPVSLGLLPRAGRIERQLNFVQRGALLHANRIAVSLEPQGGSPTGRPTGPILTSADVRQAG